MLDLDSALANVAGNKALLQELAQHYLLHYPEQTALLAAAAQAGDRDRLYSVVHSVKGASSVFGAYEVRELAAAAERCCRDNRVQDAPIAQLLSAMRLLENELRKIFRTATSNCAQAALR